MDCCRNTYFEAGGSSPHTIASCAVNGSFISMATANKAGPSSVFREVEAMGVVGRKYLESTYAALTTSAIILQRDQELLAG